MRTTKSNRTAAYYRRVSPDMVSVLDGVLFGNGAKLEVGAGVGTPVEVNGLKGEGMGGSGDSGELFRLRGEVERLKRQNMAAVEESAALVEMVADLRNRLDRCSRATEEEKLRWWIRKYDLLKAATGGDREGIDQT